MVNKVATIAEFDKLVAADCLTVVDAFATWCGPCRMIAPQIEKMATENTTVHFCKIDVDEAGELAQKLSIRAMPTFIFYKSGKEIDRMQGANPAGLAAMVAKHK